MQVRRTRSEELATVGELTVAAYEPYLLGSSDAYADQLRNAEARDLEAELWVAVAEDGEILGSVTLCPDGSPWREIALGDEGEFRMLAVAPAAQGQGVGGALVRHCLDRSRETGCSAVVLSSLEDMAPAHRLYRRLGFEPMPARDWVTESGVRLIAFTAELA